MWMLTPPQSPCCWINSLWMVSLVNLDDLFLAFDYNLIQVVSLNVNLFRAAQICTNLCTFLWIWSHFFVRLHVDFFLLYTIISKCSNLWYLHAISALNKQRIANIQTECSLLIFTQVCRNLNSCQKICPKEIFVTFDRSEQICIKTSKWLCIKWSFSEEKDI